MTTEQQLIHLQNEKITSLERKVRELQNENEQLKQRVYNPRNKKARRIGQHSKFPGVSFDTVNKVWIAKLRIDGVQKTVFRGGKGDKSTETELAAAEAYKKAKENKPQLEAKARADRDKNQEQFRREMSEFEVPAQKISSTSVKDVFNL